MVSESWGGQSTGPEPNLEFPCRADESCGVQSGDYPLHLTDPGLQPSSTWLHGFSSPGTAELRSVDTAWGKQLKGRPGLCWGPRQVGSQDYCRLGWGGSGEDRRGETGSRLPCRGGDSVPAPGGCLRQGYEISPQTGPWDGVHRDPRRGPNQCRGPELAGAQPPLSSSHYQHIFSPCPSEAQINHFCLKIKKENL